MNLNLILNFFVITIDKMKNHSILRIEVTVKSI